VKAVVISIDSPGGSPVESERIYRVIESYKQSHPKPVIAVINNIGASAAYMIALHADKIVAGNYSLVGSVGAIMAGWDLHKAIEKVEISQRVYASGTLKSMLNPFLPMTPEADRKAQELVSMMGQQFTDELVATRGPKLKAGINYGTGEVWDGVEAAKIGLVDEIGTLDDYIQRTWDRPLYDYGPRRGGLGFSAVASQWVRETLLGRSPEALSLR
jgi:protease IV